jgi:hypothetical protein
MVLLSSKKVATPSFQFIQQTLRNQGHQGQNAEIMSLCSATLERALVSVQIGTLLALCITCGDLLF